MLELKQENSLTSFAMQEEQLRHTMNEVLAYAKSKEIDAAQSVLFTENGFSVQARNRDVETLEHHQKRALEVTVYRNQQTASASTSDLSLSAIRSTVDKACSIASYAHPDPFAGLADPELMAYHYPDLQLYHPWDITPEQAITMAIECETLACQQDKRILNVEEASVSTFNSLMIYGNTHGFVGSCQSSMHTMSCSVVAAEHGQMQRDYEYTTARRATDLDSVLLIAKQVAEKTLARLGAKPIKTRQCPVIFYAPVAKSLLSHFVSAISGGLLYRHESFLVDSLGKQIFPAGFHLHQQPHLLAAAGSVPFDAEGVVTKNIDYVQDGQLTEYVLSSYSARKLGMTTTGNAGGVHNFEINHHSLNLPELMREMDTGFLVTELMGQGVNLLTGNYSRGAAGFWVERGEIKFPVEQVTIAGNLRNMFADIVKVGNDVDTRSNIRTGSILVSKMTVAGL